MMASSFGAGPHILSPGGCSSAHHSERTHAGEKGPSLALHKPAIRTCHTATAVQAGRAARLPRAGRGDHITSADSHVL